MFLPELNGVRAPEGAAAPAGTRPAQQGRRGWQETWLWYKGTAKNTLAEPDPLKRLAPAGNGIVFQRALSGIVRGKTVSLMLLPTGQMVSEPRSRAAFVQGARSGGREGSCFHVPVICCLWGRGAEGRAQLAVPDSTSAGPPAPRKQSSIFTLSLLFPDVRAPVQSCPCVTVGKPVLGRCATLTCARLLSHVPSCQEMSGRC